MNKHFLYGMIIFLLFIMGLGTYHIINITNKIDGNPIHNMMIGDNKDLVKPKDENHDAMKEHCKMMPEMPGCEIYLEVDNITSHNSEMGGNSGNIFDNSIDNLPEAKKSEIIKLKDGDTYEMVAYPVKQEVGNRIIKRLSYNGMIPGPLLQVEKGANIKLKLTNKLGIETTLHSHGLRLNNSKFDGLPKDMGGEQVAMKHGDSFTYELNFPDTGIFWYHPHIREDYTQEMGLYGNFNVTEKDYWNLVDREEFLILDDFSENDVFYKDKVNKTLMGRFGNIMMINNDENYELEVKTGEKIRFFITNVANTRTFDLSISPDMSELIEKNKKLFKVVGGDIGRIEREFLTKNQIIAPAERYIIELSFNESGIYNIISKDRLLGKIKVIGENKQIELSELRDNSKDYEIIRSKFSELLSKKPDKKLRLTIAMKGMGEMKMGMDHKDGKGNMMGGDDDAMIKKEKELGGKLIHSESEGIEWEDDMEMMNKMTNDKMMEWLIVDETDKDNIKENMDIKWTFKKGDFVKVEIYNDPNSMHPMQHPVHFHGQRFVVLTRDGKENTNLQWKDTTLVRNGETIEILIEMTNPGTWMSHCHIAEHLQSGMMMVFNVIK